MRWLRLRIALVFCRFGMYHTATGRTLFGMGLFKTQDELAEREAVLRARLAEKKGGGVKSEPAGVVEVKPAGGLSKSDPGGCPDVKHHYGVRYGVLGGKITDSGAA
jgi:hypothetical protein